MTIPRSHQLLDIRMEVIRRLVIHKIRKIATLPRIHLRFQNNDRKPNMELRTGRNSEIDDTAVDRCSWIVYHDEVWDVHST